VEVECQEVAVKVCNKCSIEKQIDQFPKHKGCKDGHSGECWTCRAAYQRDARRKQREARGPFLPPPLPGEAGVEFRHIPGFTGYAADTLGRIWTCKRPVGVWREMQPTPWEGYLRVTLWCDGRSHPRKVHRLILETFVGPCPEGMEACHDPDRNGTNCRLDNLRWGTRSENQRDSIRHGTKFQPDNAGSKHGLAKLSETNVAEIIEKAKRNPYPVIASEYGISIQTICGIMRGRCWTHVGCSRKSSDIRARLSRGGETNPSAKLTKEKVVSIRERHAAGETLTSLADEFGVTRQCVWQITERIHWRNV
jgi:hypothetical protein